MQRRRIAALLGHSNKFCDVIQWKSQRFQVERGKLKLSIISSLPVHQNVLKDKWANPVLRLVILIMML